MRDAADPGTDAPPATMLVGRERELGLLRGWLAAALAGRGRLVLIGGEAGIGKTALAEAACAEAVGHGALALVGRCYDLSETPPYGPWAEALARAPRAAELPAPPDLVGGAGAASQAALFAAVRAYLVSLAAKQPLVLLLDDLHWADPGSLDLLRVVARGLADAPLLLLATYRSDELTRRHPLYALLPTLVREARAARLDLHPLDEAGLRALAGRYPLPPAAAGRLATYLRDRAEGNPFFAGELLRALEEDGALRQDDDGWALGDLAAAGVPPLLRQVLDARVDRLGEAARELLAVAAVLGQDVPLALWAAVAGGDEEVLLAVAERAAEARLLAETPDGVGVRFAHALIREALHEGLLGPRRRALHRRAAEALAASPAPDPDAVADHFQRAGDERAAEWLVRAGERAQRAYAWLSAAARFEAALALLERRPAAAGERAWLLARLAMLRRIAQPAQALAAVVEALRLAEDAGDRALAAYAVYARGYLRGAVGDHRRGIRDMEAGLAALAALPPAERARLRAVQDALGDPAEAAYGKGILVLSLATAGRLAEARALGERLVAAAPAPSAARGVPGLLYADAYAGLVFAYAAAGRPDRARQAADRARAYFAAAGHYTTFGALTAGELRWRALVYQADDPGERQRLAALVEQADARAGGTQAVLGDHRLALQLLGGRWAEAQELGRAVRASGGQAWRRHIATAILGRVAAWQGDTALAWVLVREGLPAGADTTPEDSPAGLETPTLQRLGVALALAGGDLAAARSWLEAHDRWLAWSGAVLGRVESALGWAEYHRVAGDPAQAREHAEQALAHAGDPRQPLALLAAHRLLGELAIATGEHADARGHLADALALAAACAAPYERALTLLAAVELRAVTGERQAAGAALAEARTLLEPLGAKPALARADALAARLAAPAAPPAAHPAGLSAREVEVLRLVAQGLTDAQVAERLFLSPRTVGQHLRSVYNKLGVSSRLATTRFAIEHGLA